MYELTVRTSFAAAHRLAMAGKKCENLHGHNWRIEVRLQGETLGPDGMLVDFGEVKEHLARIMEGLDHKFLNEIPAFAGRPPSSENIARHVAEELSAALGVEKVRVAGVTAWESEDACAAYIP